MYGQIYGFAQDDRFIRLDKFEKFPSNKVKREESILEGCFALVYSLVCAKSS